MNLIPKGLFSSIALLLIAYFFGAFSEVYNLFPLPAVRAAKRLIIPHKTPPSRFAFDQMDRLVSDDHKSSLSCPQMTDRTAVLLLLGQSNAANSSGQRIQSQHQAQVVNFFDGQCFIAELPLLGSSGSKGEYWTQLGNLLIESGAFDQVVLAPATLSGSEVARWARGGDLNDMLLMTTAQLQQHNYRITHVLWHQGEIDYVIGTSEKSYRENFLSMVDSLRDRHIKAPVFVSVASKCLEASNGGTSYHSADNPVTRAQVGLPNDAKGIRGGINTDALLGELDRYDDCHFSASGAQKVAKAWAELLAEK